MVCLHGNSSRVYFRVGFWITTAMFHQGMSRTGITEAFWNRVVLFFVFPFDLKKNEQSQSRKSQKKRFLPFKQYRYICGACCACGSHFMVPANEMEWCWARTGQQLERNYFRKALISKALPSPRQQMKCPKDVTPSVWVAKYWSPNSFKGLNSRFFFHLFSLPTGSSIPQQNCELSQWKRKRSATWVNDLRNNVELCAKFCPNFTSQEGTTMHENMAKLLNECWTCCWKHIRLWPHYLNRDLYLAIFWQNHLNDWQGICHRPFPGDGLPSIAQIRLKHKSCWKKYFPFIPWNVSFDHRVEYALRRCQENEKSRPWWHDFLLLPRHHSVSILHGTNPIPATKSSEGPFSALLLQLRVHVLLDVRTFNAFRASLSSN